MLFNTSIVLDVIPCRLICQLYGVTSNTTEILISTAVRSPERLRWSRGSVSAFSTQVRGFKPGRSRRIFKDEKILSTPSFGGEVKPSVPCHRFTACKRNVECTWKSVFLGKITGQVSRPQISSTFRCFELSRRVRQRWEQLEYYIGRAQ